MKLLKTRTIKTIGEVISQNKRLVFTCRACKAVVSKQPNDLFFKSNMELKALEDVSACSECGAANISGEDKLLILTVES